MIPIAGYCLMHDFMTLLFAFFVVLYAMSSVNVNKYKAVAKSFGYAFDRTKSIKEVKNNITLDKKISTENIEIYCEK